MSGDAPKDYKIGYRRPPAGSRFEKGHSGNPRGRPSHKAAPQVNFAGLMDDIITVRLGSEMRSMPRKEAQMRSIFKRVLEKRRVRDIKYLMGQFEKYGAMAIKETQSGVLRLPKNLPWELAGMLLARYGKPPWTKQQIKNLKPAYLATRSEEQRLHDIKARFLYDEDF